MENPTQMHAEYVFRKHNAGHPNVISVFLNKARKLHTTHSWDFMRLEKNGIVHRSSLWKKAEFGQDIIIANLDTGNYVHQGL